MNRISNSVGVISRPFDWVKENVSLFRMRFNGLQSTGPAMVAVLDEVDAYALKFKEETGNLLRDASILEIGFGARPNRLLAMISLGYNAKGIDLDKPVLNFGLRDVYAIYKNNGFKRALKSLVRGLVFDGHERRALNRALMGRGATLKLDEKRFLVGDASTFYFPKSSIDFIYSEDVFEHIEPSGIHTLSLNLSNALSSDGLALISPFVFSGIAGGHLVEWYTHTFSVPMNRRSEPWEHLRKRRYVADCYLNELRVHEYREIFAKYFNINEVISREAGIGREFLTDEIRRELSDYSDEELLSNKWTFVLSKKVV